MKHQPLLTIIAVSIAAFMACNNAMATETVQTEGHTPFTSKTKTVEYEPNQRAFEDEVASRADELRRQPNGGDVWVNRVDQPTVTTTETQTLKVDVQGYGGSVTRQASLSPRVPTKLLSNR